LRRGRAQDSEMREGERSLETASLRKKRELTLAADERVTAQRIE